MSTHVRAGLKLLEQGRFAEADAALSRALKKHRRNPNVLQSLGMARFQTGRTEEGLRLMRKAIGLAPGDAPRWVAYGAYLHYAGRIGEASAAMLKAADMLPNAVIPLYNYCNFARPGLDHPVVERLRGLLEGGELTASGRSYVRYALAQVCEKNGLYEAAMDHALAGGREYGVECNLDLDGARRTIAANTPAALRRQPCGGDPTEAPVFILGMPRSGTTLTEQILSRHPDVLAAGELSGGRTVELLAMQWAAQNAPIANAHEAVAHIVPEVEEVAAAHHLEIVGNVAAGAAYRRFTDKLPENVFRLGLLGRIFPNARVVVVRRHPLDTCVSCLMKRFNDVQYSYTNSMETLGAQYQAYEAVLEHWREASPLRILELRYESLVADFEPNVRRLVDFLGLDWDPACLSPQDSARMVNTASAGQIREGVNDRSIAKWRRYESRLGPLVEALGGMDRIEAWAAR